MTLNDLKDILNNLENQDEKDQGDVRLCFHLPNTDMTVFGSLRYIKLKSYNHKTLYFDLVLGD